MKVYTVRACRWGEDDTHSYIVGVYSTKTKAGKAADTEEEYRGGKYNCEIIELDIDSGMEGRMTSPGFKTIKAPRKRFGG